MPLKRRDLPCIDQSMIMTLKTAKLALNNGALIFALKWLYINGLSFDLFNFVNEKSFICDLIMYWSDSTVPLTLFQVLTEQPRQMLPWASNHYVILPQIWIYGTVCILVLNWLCNYEVKLNFLFSLFLSLLQSLAASDGGEYTWVVKRGIQWF